MSLPVSLSLSARARARASSEEDRSIQILKAKKILQQQAEQKEIEKGQRTAVFTGVISLVLGVAYLFIVFLLDSRGSELKPPPPEAFL